MMKQIKALLTISLVSITTSLFAGGGIGTGGGGVAAMMFKAASVSSSSENGLLSHFAINNNGNLSINLNKIQNIQLNNGQIFNPANEYFNINGLKIENNNVIINHNTPVIYDILLKDDTICVLPEKFCN